MAWEIEKSSDDNGFWIIDHENKIPIVKERIWASPNPQGRKYDISKLVLSETKLLWIYNGIDAGYEVIANNVPEEKINKFMKENLYKSLRYLNKHTL